MFLVALILVVVVLFIVIMVVMLGIKNIEHYQSSPPLVQSLTLPFDKFNVYLINLERKPERLARFIKAYNQTDLGQVKQFKRIEAVDGRKVDIREHVSAQAWKDIQDVEWFNYRTKHNQLTVGAVGCYLSHLKTYSDLVASKFDYGIIFEDDVKFVKPQIYQQIVHYMNILPNDWDILLLGCVCQVCKKYTKYQDLKHFFLLHAYIIKRTSAENILSELEYKPIRQQIDSELSTMASADKVKILCLNSSLVIQDNKVNTTTIQTPLKVLKGVNPFEIPMA